MELDQWERSRVERLVRGIDAANRIRQQAAAQATFLSTKTTSTRLTKNGRFAYSTFVTKIANLLRNTLKQSVDGFVRTTGIRFLITAFLLLSVVHCSAQTLSEPTDTQKLNDGLIAYTVGDFSSAFAQLHPLAEKNMSLAQLFVGRAYADGIGVAQNCERATHWLTLAAQNGNAEAAYDLGSANDQGRCMHRNPFEAIAWYRIAAANGDTRAPNAIGEIYLRHIAYAPNAQTAALWFKRGTRLFDKNAYYHLGEMHAFGYGVPRDLIEAYKWFDLAANLDVPDQPFDVTKSAVERDKIREELTPPQVREGIERANQYFGELLADKDIFSNSHSTIEPDTVARVNWKAEMPAHKRR